MYNLICIVANSAGIRSTKVKTRVSAYQDLRAFLATETLNDGDLNKALTCLFSAIIKDRAAYNDEAQNSAYDRLHQAGDLVWRIVESGMSIMRSKTVKVLVDGIRSTLPKHGTDYLCKPLLNPYSKTCVLLTSHPEHIEHLGQASSGFMLFLCKVASSIIESGEKLISVLSDFYAAILSLLSIPMVVDHSILVQVQSHIVFFLSKNPQETIAHRSVMACANRLINYTITNHVGNSQAFSAQVFDCLSHISQFKHSSSIQEVAVFVIQAFEPLKLYLLTHDHQEDSADASDPVQDKIRLLSVIREIMDTFPLEWIDCNSLSFQVPADARPSLFSQPLFAIDPASSTYLAWIKVLACYKLFLLSSISISHKRAKTSGGKAASSSVIEPTHEQIIDSLLQLRDNSRMNLQLLAFAAQYASVPTALHLCDRLWIHFSARNSNELAWALIAIGLASQSFEQTFEKDGMLAWNAWTLAQMHMHNPSVSSAACFCLSRLLKSGRFPDEDSINSIFSDIANGSLSLPISSGALDLCQASMLLKAMHPSFSSAICRSIQSWLCRSSGDYSISLVPHVAYTLALCTGSTPRPFKSPELHHGLLAEYDRLISEASPIWAFLSSNVSLGLERPIPQDAEVLAAFSPVSASISKGIVDATLEHVTSLTDKGIITGMVLAYLLLSLAEFEPEEPGFLSGAFIAEHQEPISVSEALSIVWANFDTESPWNDLVLGQFRSSKFSFRYDYDSANTGWLSSVDSNSMMSADSQPPSTKAVTFPHGYHSFAVDSQVRILSVKVYSRITSETDFPDLREWCQDMPVPMFVIALDAIPACLGNDPSYCGYLLQYIGSHILQSYTWGRSEVGLAAVIRFIEKTAAIWMASEEYKLDAVDVVKFVAQLVVERGHLSPVLGCQLSRLLIKLQNSSCFTQDERDIYSQLCINLVCNLDNSVGYESASNLTLANPVDLALTSDLYSRFLESHGPIARDDVERMAVRCYILLQLGCSGCDVASVVYNLLEMTQVPALHSHITSCMMRLATCLGHTSARKLFQASSMYLPIVQLLQNREDRDIPAVLSELPLPVCGYTMLEEFLSDFAAVVLGFAAVDDGSDLADCVAYVNKYVPKESVLMDTFTFASALSFATTKPDLLAMSQRIATAFGSEMTAKAIVTGVHQKIICQVIQLIDFRDKLPAGANGVVIEMFEQEQASLVYSLPAPYSLSVQDGIYAIRSVSKATGISDIWTEGLFVSAVRESVKLAESYSTRALQTARRLVFVISQLGSTNAYALNVLLLALASLVPIKILEEDLLTLIKVVLTINRQTLRSRDATALSDFVLKILNQLYDSQPSDQWKSAVAWMAEYLSTVGRSGGDSWVFVLAKECCNVLLGQELSSGDLILHNLVLAPHLLNDTVLHAALWCLKGFRVAPESVSESFASGAISLLKRVGSEPKPQVLELHSTLARALGLAYLRYGEVLLSTKEANDDLFVTPSGIDGKQQAFDGLFTVLLKAVARNNFEELGALEQTIRGLVSSLSGEPKRLLLGRIDDDLFEVVQSGTVDSVCLSSVNISDSPYQQWLHEVLAGLFDGAVKGLTGFQSFLHVDYFAEEALKYIMLESLLQGDFESKQFLDQVFTSVINGDDLKRGRLILDCCLFLRTHSLARDSVGTNLYIDIDYRRLAELAGRLNMPKTELMLSELSWVDEEEEEITKLRSLHTMRSGKAIDDPDFYYGLPQEPSLLMSLVRPNNNLATGTSLWNRFVLQSAMYEEIADPDSNESPYSDLSSSLLDLGMHGLAKLVSKSGFPQTDVFYEYGWKQEKWDLPVPASVTTPNQAVYRALKGMDLEASYQFLVQELDLERLSIVYEVEEIRASSQSPDSVFYLQRERTARLLKGQVLSGFESILTARVVSQSFGDSPATFLSRAQALIDFNRVIYMTGSTEKAVRQVVKLVRLAESVRGLDVGKIIEIGSLVESANLMWALGDMIMSTQLLKERVIGAYDAKSLDDVPATYRTMFDPCLLYSKLAEWTFQARLDRDEVILEEYLSKAVELLDGSSSDARTKVYHTFATFCDDRQSNADSQVFYNNAKMLRDRKQAELVSIKDAIRNSRDRTTIKQLEAEYSKAMKDYTNDNAEYKRLQRNKEQLVQKSVLYYMMSIMESDEYPADVSRFFALWLGYSDNEAVNEVISPFVKGGKLPMNKIVAWVNQLSARLEDVKTPFQINLWRLLLSMCKRHPFHCQYQFYSMIVDGNDGTVAARYHAGLKFWKLLDTSSLAGIADLSRAIVQLSRVNPPGEVKQMGFGSLATRAVVNHNSDQYSEEELSKMRRFWMSTISELRVPPPTMHIAVRADADYKSVPRISRVRNEMIIATGISRPKIVRFETSDGESHTALVKGNDDLRQDAIMEQVFAQVNGFLAQDSETRKRELQVRTYKVVPVGKQAGIIEFVKNTKAAQDIFGALHKKYRPKDMTANAARNKMKAVANSPVAARVAVFRQIQEEMKPVFRWFFFEQYKSPDVWFKCRTHYSRSMAVMSLLGHVIGLGDRHSNNILFDTQTGEVVHIDFGYVFDQAKLLTVPETVPFRLTRDFVDGMGITGVEGIYRRCCELTMKVLRQELENVETILNVLRTDPLYSWTISPLKRARAKENKVQDDLGDEGKAERAITVIRQKLSGHLSVQTSIRDLIRQAMDEENLAVMYCGWSPFY